ncbi:P-loop containing nucleoside triphosphate hydrolase protein, partial [Roridomyces roridus]
LPAPPQIFHGRESELNDIIHSLTEDHARVTILGTGGMGKTSLALAAMHHATIVAKYPHRHFIACQSANNCAELLSLVASHTGMEVGSQTPGRIIQQFRVKPQTLVVLDNFESPWEALDARPEVEEFLSMLGDLAHVAIIVTLRGTERPGKIRWSRPFLSPLKPLSESDAYQVFVDIAGSSHEGEQVRTLLRFTGHLPLAVSLMANVASFETCDTVLEQWRTERTNLLSEGSDTRSNLNVSIKLSFESPRMTEDTRQLLSLLAILPDGLSDVELLQGQLPIPNILSAKMALLQTSLAYTDNTRRIRVLVPIQEFICHIAPPSN